MNPDPVRDERRFEREETAGRRPGGAAAGGEQGGEGGGARGGEGERGQAGSRRAYHGESDGIGGGSAIPVRGTPRAGSGAGLGGCRGVVHIARLKDEMAAVPTRSMVKQRREEGGRMEIAIGSVYIPVVARYGSPCRPSPFKAAPVKNQLRWRDAAMDSRTVGDPGQRRAPQVSTQELDKVGLDQEIRFQIKEAQLRKACPRSDDEELVDIYGQLWSVPSPRKVRVPAAGGRLVWIRKDLFLAKSFDASDCYPAREADKRQQQPKRFSFSKDLWKKGSGRATYTEVVMGVTGNRGGGRRGGGGGAGRGDSSRATSDQSRSSY